MILVFYLAVTNKHFIATQDGKPFNQKKNRYSFNFYQHSEVIYAGYNAILNYYAQTRNRFSYRENFNYDSKNKDYFEPRQRTASAIYFLLPKRKNINI